MYFNLIKCLWIHSIFCFSFWFGINQSYRRMSWLHTIVHMRSTDCPNLVNTCSDCSCTLLIVIAKASRNGNRIRLNSNDIFIGIIRIRGNSISSLLNFRFKIAASMTLFIIFITESLIPFQSLGGLMFQKRMMATPIFNVKMCGGIPGKSSEIKNSVG